MLRARGSELLEVRPMLRGSEDLKELLEVRPMLRARGATLCVETEEARHTGASKRRR
jgi:hypothetical protein